MTDSTGTVSLREITKDSLLAVLRLKVAPSQERLVATNAVSIAQAHFQPEVAWFRAIYLDETPVGFVMIEEDTATPKYTLWRFMVDERYQGQGIGRRAIGAIMDHVRTLPGATELFLSCVPGEASPGPFYEKLGFAYTGEEDDGELIMRQDL